MQESGLFDYLICPAGNLLFFLLFVDVHRPSIPELIQRRIVFSQLISN